MKIQEQDRFHGPALVQIVEHDSFTALNKVDKKYGHYQVNANTFLWMKYASAEQGPWQFTFNASDITGFGTDLSHKKNRVYQILVCGTESICCLTADETTRLIDLNSPKVQWIKVDAPAGKQMRVTGSSHTAAPLLVPHSRFPGELF